MGGYQRDIQNESSVRLKSIGARGSYNAAHRIIFPILKTSAACFSAVVVKVQRDDVSRFDESIDDDGDAIFVGVEAVDVVQDVVI